MDRNTVILDGNRPANPKGSNGIEIGETQRNKVELVNNVTIENLPSATSNRNRAGRAVTRSGGTAATRPAKVGAHGWYGRYLTAYDTGLNGSYGIFTNNEIEGEWEHIYASGFNDSGMYLGACQECKARITYATMEYNAARLLGLELRRQPRRSKTRSSATTPSGVAPNAENPGDPPPPQDGECNRHEDSARTRTQDLPEITSTEIKRCTIIRHNLITENNNITAPATGSAEGAPFGAGVELPGDYADAIEENEITNNASDGMLAFEYPNPFPPVAEVTIFFQNSGNKVANNTFSGTATWRRIPAVRRRHRVRGWRVR